MSVGLVRSIRLGSWLLCPRASWDGHGARVDRILVAAEMGIGNMVMFTPFLGALRAGFPNAHIAALFCRPTVAEELLDGSPLVDEVINLRSSALPIHRRIAAGINLGRRGWDMAIARFNSQSPEIMFAMVTGRIRYRVGHISGGGWTSGNDFLFNVPVRVAPNEHEADQYLAIARTLGLKVLERAPSIHLDAVDRHRAAAALQRLGIGQGDQFVAIQPGSSRALSWKRWPKEAWKALVRRLADIPVPVVALGSADERELTAFVCDGTPAMNLAGQCTLRESAYILGQAITLVCTDSGLMHVAAAMGTPVVALFGPTDVQRTGPLGEGHVILSGCDRATPCYGMSAVLRSDCAFDRCMAGILAERVLAEVALITGRVAGHHTRRSTGLRVS